jgi:outer membrane lipoprotein-sorting protein
MKMSARAGLSLAALTVSAAAALAGGTVALADAPGDRLVASLDAAMNRAKTLSFEYEIVNKEAGKDERTLAMKVLLKGDKRLSEFSAPADMKGTKVLILSPTQMYVYLPAFGKVRRIASHTKDQGFLGLSFSQDDMATTSYGALYAGAITADTPAQVTLVLTPKPGQDAPYSKIEMLVTKDHMVPSQLRYFNAEGANVKTETRTGYTCEGDVCTPGELKMTDNVKGSWTKLIAKSRKVNADISDDLFTQRNLGE